MFKIEDFKGTSIRICKIKTPYLNYIRNFDHRIPVKGERKYIGLIININGMQYVVPLTSKGTNERILNGKNKRSPLVTTNIKDVADILHNNMFPTPESEIIDIKEISAESDSYLNYEYRFIRKKWAKINIKSMNIYQNRYNNEDRDYNFLKFICCDFKKLEIECKGWAYDHLVIKIKEQYRLKEYIEINKNTEIFSLVEVNDYGTYSRVENYDENNSELQSIKIYAKDEFGQEKFVEAVIKVKDGETLTQIDEKELQAVQ